MQKKTSKTKQAEAMPLRKTPRKSMASTATADVADARAAANIDASSMLLSAAQYIIQNKQDLYGQEEELQTLAQRITEAITCVKNEGLKRDVLDLERKLEEAEVALSEAKAALAEAISEISFLKEAKLESEVNAVENENLRKECESLRSRLSSLQRDFDDRAVCVICHEHPRDVVLFPCYHFHFCLHCIILHKKLNGDNCPTCRGIINGFCNVKASS